MTEGASLQANLGPTAAAPIRPVIGYGARVFRDAFRRGSARVGAFWIVLLLLSAVFAPFLANSHPLAMKVDGQWSSPMLRHLTPADVLILIAFFSGIVLLAIPRVRFIYKLLTLAVIVLLLAYPAFVLVKPPQAIDYSRYRQGLAEKTIERAIFAPIPYSPSDRLRDQRDTRLQAPSSDHLMGTEDNGGDVLSRMIHACRIALSIGFIATGIAVIIGVIIGGLMGYYSGVVDLIGMRLVEIFSAIPTLFLLIACVAFLGRNLYLMMVIIGLTSWVGDARFIRAEFLKLRQQDFVQAAIACGLPVRSILFRHMLPNGIAPVLVSASFGVASAILAESTLSFLGLGLVDEPSWGQMLNQALGASGGFSWWIALYPGAAIFLTVFAYNLVGEALRDAIDPSLAAAARA